MRGSKKEKKRSGEKFWAFCISKRRRPRSFLIFCFPRRLQPILRRPLSLLSFRERERDRGREHQALIDAFVGVASRAEASVARSSSVERSRHAIRDQRRRRWPLANDGDCLFFSRSRSARAASLDRCAPADGMPRISCSALCGRLIVQRASRAPCVERDGNRAPTTTSAS